MKSIKHFSKIKRGLECLNCGQPLHGNENFCPECGQVNDEIPLSIKQFISEFFAGFLSFDTQFFNTIVPLVFKPGKVSKEYIKGKRRKYSNPFKMYLHTSIVFFLLLGLNSTISNFKNLNTKDVNAKTKKDSITNVSKESDAEVDKLDFDDTFNHKLDSVFQHTNYISQFNAENIPQDVKDSLYNQLYEMGMKIKLVDTEPDYVGEGKIDIHFKSKKSHKLAVKNHLKRYFKENTIHYKPPKTSELEFGVDFDNKVLEKSEFGKFVSFSKNNKDLSPIEALDSLRIEKTRMNLFKYQKAQEINKLAADKDFRKSFTSSIISKISIALFFLLPLFTVFFSLLYMRHPYSYTEHLVVVFNLQTVFFLLLIIGLIIDNILKTSVFNTTIFPIIFQFYFYKTLRNFYQQRRFKTIIKYFILNFIYFFLAFIGVIVVSFIAFII